MNPPRADATAMTATDADAADGDRVVMALLYLLVRLMTGQGSLGVVMAIGQHLEMLSAHSEVSASLRSTALQLRDDWLHACAQAQAVARRDEPAANVMH
jgi:hypothetical protein